MRIFQDRCPAIHIGPWTIIWYDKKGRGKVYDVEKCQHCGATRNINIRRQRKGDK